MLQYKAMVIANLGLEGIELRVLQTTQQWPISFAIDVLPLHFPTVIGFQKEAVDGIYDYPLEERLEGLHLWSSAIYASTGMLGVILRR